MDQSFEDSDWNSSGLDLNLGIRSGHTAAQSILEAVVFLGRLSLWDSTSPNFLFLITPVHRRLQAKKTAVAVVPQGETDRRGVSHDCNAGRGEVSMFPLR
jgi:hypothetical protein